MCVLKNVFDVSGGRGRGASERGRVSVLHCLPVHKSPLIGPAGLAAVISCSCACMPYSPVPLPFSLSICLFLSLTNCAVKNCKKKSEKERERRRSAVRHQSVTVDKLKCSKQRQKGHSDSSTTEQSRGVVKGGARKGGGEGKSLRLSCGGCAAL